MRKQYNIKIVNTNYTITPDDDFIGVDVSGWPINISFPAVATIGVRKTVYIRNVIGNASINPITLGSLTTDFFNNFHGTYVINTNGGSVKVESDYFAGFVGHWNVYSGLTNSSGGVIWQLGNGAYSAEVIGNGTNRANGDYSTASGNNNAAEADYSSAQGWDNNQVHSPYGWVRGWLNNDVQTTTPHGAIYGGNLNFIQGMGGNYSTIFHGDRNIINSNGVDNHFRWGNQNNIYSGSYNNIFSNTGSSFYGNYGMAAPGNHQIRTNYNFVSGNRALWFEDGARVHAKPTTSPGYFWVSQISDNLFGWQSSGATPFNVITSANYSMFVDQVRAFTIKVTAVQTAGIAGTIWDCSYWEIKGMIKRDWVVSFVGTPTVTLITQDAGAAAWTVGITISWIGINVTVTWEADKDINWLTHISEVQTGYRNIQP